MHKIFSQFFPGERLLNFKPFGNGHINDTFLTETSRGNFILQRVNKNIFRIEELVANFEVLFNTLDDFEGQSGFKLTHALYRTNSGKYHFVDDEGFAWRLAELLPGAISHEISGTPETSYLAAKAMGKFQLFLNTLPLEKFSDTIVNFHDLPRRFRDYQKSLKTSLKDRLEKAKHEIGIAGRYGYIVSQSLEAVDGVLVRITHNDTKINNILFSGDQILVIDLDTVMAGVIMHDYGDMVRTFSSPAAEDEPNLKKVVFRMEHFKALTKGYLEPLKDNLSDKEKKSLLTGAKSIIYEQSLRFLTDFLNGDIYYKTAYPEHNLVRTRTQFKLLESIIKNERKLNEIINDQF